MSEWIPVEDKLPKLRGIFPSDIVLVVGKTGIVRLGYRQDDKMKISCDACWPDEEITHWMELPGRPE